MVLDIVDCLRLQADLLAFVEEHEETPAVSDRSRARIPEIPSLDKAFAKPAKKPRKARNVGLAREA